MIHIRISPLNVAVGATPKRAIDERLELRRVRGQPIRASQYL
jgi:hypothetical protein